MTDSIFKEAIEIIEILEENGYESYIVGGSVRDYVLGRPVDDIDLATNAPVEKVQAIFPAVIPVGVEFGTVIVRHKGKSYEVTTFRQDEASSEKTLKKDLMLRDFTMNALAMDKHLQIIDFFQGKKDIKQKVIRGVHDPYARLREDPLRVLRALRFVSELGFSIDHTTLLAMKEEIQSINKIALERIANEFIQIVKGLYVKQSMQYMTHIQGLSHLPLFNTSEQLRHICESVNEPFTHFSEAIAYFHLLYDKIQVVEWSNQWRLSNDTKKRAIHLVEMINYYKQKGLDDWLLYRLNDREVYSFVSLINRLNLEKNISAKTLLKRKSSLPIKSRADLEVTGRDIIAQFPDRKRGRWINELLEKVEYEIVMNRLKNDKTTIKEWISCHPPAKN